MNDAVNWIESVKRFGDKYDLSRIELACKLLGNPEKDLPVIHIAGTNGKGSTVTYLKYMLLEQGYNVGTFTSPYIVRFNERITYNYNDISDEEFLYYVNIVYELYERVKNEYQDIVTFFELVTLISFLYFKDKDVDFVIYEVGLGGRLDATNVVRPLVTAITSISYDHMNVLGNTLEEIALNKLGIVKKGIPLVTYDVNDDLRELFITYANNHQSDITIVNNADIENIKYDSHTNFIYKNQPYTISMIGNHQVYNASLAIEIIHQLQRTYRTKISLENIKQGLLRAFWPGRLERFGNIIIDGAHNIGGMTALKDTMQHSFGEYYIKAMYTSMEDKEYYDIIQLLESFVDEIHFTQFDYPRCETAENLYQVSSIDKKFLHLDVYQCLEELKELKEQEILLITGSLYFISLIRKELLKLKQSS